MTKQELTEPLIPAEDNTTNQILPPGTENDGSFGDGAIMVMGAEDEDCETRQDDIEEDDDYDTAGTATIVNEVFNLVKNIVGSGGLGLPAGIAAFSNAPSGMIPAVLLLILMGVINAYSFSLIGRVCDHTKTKTFQDTWDKTMGHRHGTHLNPVVGLVVMGKTFLGCWAKSIIIGNTAERLFHTIGWNRTTKVEALIGATILILLPLCLTRRLSSLAYFSVMGVIGTFVTAFTMALRFFDGSYFEGGEYYNDIPESMRPSFGDKGWKSFFSPQAPILISIVSTGYLAHYNAPKYYFELKSHTPQRFNVVVGISFLIAAFVVAAFGSLGFLTFGASCADYILDNYSTKDPFATVSRFGVIFSLVFAYPLLFIGGRDALMALLHIPTTSTNTSLSSLIMLVVVTCLAILVNDLTFVLAFGGATLATCIIFVFPPLMFRGLVKNDPVLWNVPSNQREVWMSTVMLCFGVVLGVLGTVVSVRDAFL